MVIWGNKGVSPIYLNSVFVRGVITLGQFMKLCDVTSEKEVG